MQGKFYVTVYTFSHVHAHLSEHYCFSTVLGVHTHSLYPYVHILPTSVTHSYMQGGFRINIPFL